MPQATPLPNTFGEVLQRCQSLMGDRTGRWVTLAYASDFINQAYEDMTEKIKNASGKNFEGVVELLNVPTGTSDLSPYQTPGDLTANPPVNPGPLAGLFDPIRMWAKSAGTLPQYYQPAVGPRDTLPHVNPPGVTPGTPTVQVTFAWLGNKLSITPVAGAIDIQVYGRFNPPRLQKSTDQLLLASNMSFTLAYFSCALMGVERTNPAILAGYVEQGNAGVDNIVADIIRQSQKQPRRVGKIGGQGGTYFGWGWGNI